MRGPALAATLALAACGSEAPPPAPGNAMRQDAAEAAGAPSAPDLPPADAPLRFVGLWAAEEGLCTTTAWRFTADGLTTPAGSVCRFERVEPVPGGYDVAARCTAEAPERDDRLRLRFAESAGGMTFESDSIADAGLVYCGPAG